MPLTDLIALAAGQDGLFRTADARRHSVSPRMLTRLRASGEVARVHRGIYRFSAVEPSRHGTIAAALMAAGDEAVASHATAAELLGVDRIEAPAEPHVTVPGKAKPRLAGVTVHRTTELRSVDVVTEDGLRCTGGARTAIDLGPELTAHDAIALVDDLICARHTSRTWLHRRATDLRSGRAGLAPIIRVTRPDAEGEFWSWLERSFGSLVARERLPMPHFNVPLPGTRNIIVDALWTNPPLVVELDGLRFHRTPEQRRKDAARGNTIALSGWPLLRYTWHDVMEDQRRIVTELRAALQR